ncbi:MAG: hypothetical protein LBH21_05495 [Gracilibacteraceae bacterium]|jgi:flagellar M-ring protein FliF|nr:hypothetical protein [Gracilibacteraceae bacterium]
MNFNNLRDKYLRPVLAWWQALESKRRRRIIIIAGILLAAIIALVIFLNYQPYVTLFTSLSSAEAAEILARLQEMGVGAKVNSGGAILVPKDQEAALKMSLATEGYPKSGFSYDIYVNNVGAMTTDSDRRAYRLFQLQERMRQAVRTISGVTDAVVTISENTAGSSVLTNSQAPASASVLVTVLGGEDLTAAQVNGIKQLVAKGVQGMNKEDVAVINSVTGNEMGASADSVSGRATDKMEIEKQIDSVIETKVRDILRPLLGEGYATVVATSRVSTDAGVVQSVTYTPMAEDGTTGVTAREEHYLEGRNEELLAAGAPGAETNADIPTYEELMNGEGGGYFVNKYDYDYYVNERKEQVERSDVVIESIGVSVVIFSDTLTEIDRVELTSLVARTANVPEEDVFIMMREFESPPPPPSTMEYLRDNWWIAVAAAILLLAVAAVVIIIVIRRRQRRTMEEFEQAAREEEEARMRAETEIPVPEESQQQKLSRQIKSFADEHPEIAAQLIRSWLKGDE